MIIGIGYFITKWKKPTIAFISIILILSVFGTIRDSYNQTQFLTQQEENTNEFLAKTLPAEKIEISAIGQVNWGFFHFVIK